MSPLRGLLQSLLGCCAAWLVAGCVSFHQGPLPGEPADETFIQLAQARVHYRDQAPEQTVESDRPPVVLIHGFASSLNNWALMAPALAQDRRVISLDLQGFGWTDRPEGADYSPQGQAALVLDLLASLEVTGPFDVVAHSWGSSVALAVVQAAPERVRRVLLFDAWVYEDQIPTFFVWTRAPGLGEALMGMFYQERPADKMLGAFYDPKYVTQALVDEVERQLARPGAVAGALAAIRGHSRFAELEAGYGQITQPVMLLWGREDHVTPLWVGERLVRQLPRAGMKVYPRCGHFPMIEAMPEALADVQRFLDAPAAEVLP
jgi:pimeloyl-ACP methyl ester carboxylesterase